MVSSLFDVQKSGAVRHGIQSRLHLWFGWQRLFLSAILWRNGRLKYPAGLHCWFFPSKTYLSVWPLYIQTKWPAWCVPATGNKSNRFADPHRWYDLMNFWNKSGSPAYREHHFRLFGMRYSSDGRRFQSFPVLVHSYCFLNNGTDVYKRQRYFWPYTDG